MLRGVKLLPSTYYLAFTFPYFDPVSDVNYQNIPILDLDSGRRKSSFDVLVFANNPSFLLAVLSFPVLV